MDAPLISFIIPFYRKLAWLQAVFPRNHVFQSPRVEVVLVLDEPTCEKEVLEFVRQQPARVRVLVNDKDHDWRPPCAAINVGIRHALGQFIVVVSPESYVLVEPGYLERRVLELPSKPVLVGTLWHGLGIEVEHSYEQVKAFAESHQPAGNYGFMCCSRTHIIAVGGYDERRKFYGGDDDELRNRLYSNGGVQIIDPGIRIVHPYHDKVARVWATEPYAASPIFDFESLGRDFSRVVFDYASVAQLAEHLASIQNVVGSYPITRSNL